LAIGISSNPKLADPELAQFEFGVGRVVRKDQVVDVPADSLDPSRPKMDVFQKS
jgi:hypothetical protein